MDGERERGCIRLGGIPTFLLQKHMRSSYPNYLFKEDKEKNHTKSLLKITKLQQTHMQSSHRDSLSLPFRHPLVLTIS